MAFELAQPLRIFRIGHPAYPLWDGSGAATHGGRWNPVGSPVVYAASHYSLALLETLANLSSRTIPPTFVRSHVLLPDGCLAERVYPQDDAGWDSPDRTYTQALGQRWLAEARSLVLIVPSAVVEGLEDNVVINPLHPDFASLKPSTPEPVRWDERLLRSGLSNPKVKRPGTR